MLVRIGTRGSQLATAQTGLVAEMLKAATGCEVELIIIKTRGDELQTLAGGPSRSLGTGLFTKALEQALLNKEIDAAVHSLKDLPCQIEDDFVLAAIPEREDTSDALCGREKGHFKDLPQGARIGTGSPRRQAFILAARPDLKVEPIRGNIDSRLRKLQEGEHPFDAVVLALSGLKRAGLGDRMTDRLDMLPAPGQGALALECRANDEATKACLSALDHMDTRLAAQTERQLHERLGGGCLTPLGALATIENGRIRLKAAVASLCGQKIACGEGETAVENIHELIEDVAQQLFTMNAKEILEEAREALA
jgi:hydroxymethylbilane synthase